MEENDIFSPSSTFDSKKVQPSEDKAKEEPGPRPTPLIITTYAENKTTSKIEDKNRRKSQLKKIEKENLENFVEKSTKYSENGKKKKIIDPNNSRNFMTNFTSNIFVKLAGAMTQSLVTILSCVVYVTNTYLDDDQYDSFFSLTEILFATFFGIDYLWGFYRSKNKVKFFFHYLSIIDLITILPVFVSTFSGNKKSSLDSFSKIVALVRVLRVFRVLRLYRLFTSKGQNKSEGLFVDMSEIKRKIFMIISTIAAIIFIATGVTLAFFTMSIGFDLNVPPDSTLTFDSALYFIVTTVTTVGYGDISAKSTLARVVVALFILIIITVVTAQTSELNQLMKFSSVYRLPYKGDQKKHIVLTGNNITSMGVLKFLAEFYHPDHSRLGLKVLIVQNSEPTKEFRSTVLNNPLYEDKIQYLAGSIFRETTLNLARIKGTKIFIMANQFSMDSKKDDSFSLLASKSLKEYDSSSSIYVQVVNPTYTYHSWANWNVVMSTDTYKMGIIVNNIFNPGFSTIISNFVISTGSIEKKRIKLPNWFVEFSEGASKELYSFPFELDKNRYFIGKDFMTVCKEIYNTHNILMIGLRTPAFARKDGEHYEVVINPINYKIKERDYAIVVAKNEEELKLLWLEPCRPLNETLGNSGLKSQISALKIDQKIKTSLGKITKGHYSMWENDMRGRIKRHIIVFGIIERLPTLYQEFEKATDQYICFVSNKPPDENWEHIRRNHQKAIYFEASLTDPEEIAKTAIESASHVVLLTWLTPNSSIQDAGILPIVKLLIEHFPRVPFTVEFLDESNLRYLDSRLPSTWGNIAYNMWPRFAASNVFFSSVIDNLLAQTFYNECIIDVVGKLISSHIKQNHSGIPENSQVNSITIPDTLVEEVEYGDLWNEMTSRNPPLLPFGILRGRDAQTNELAYAITNPTLDTKILKGDILLVLGQTAMAPSLLPHTFYKSVFESKKLRLANMDKGATEPVISPTTYTDEEEEYNTQKGDITKLIQKIIEQDENLDVDNDTDRQKLEEMLGISSNDRIYLINQTNKLKSLLSENAKLKEELSEKLDRIN